MSEQSRMWSCPETTLRVSSWHGSKIRSTHLLTNTFTGSVVLVVRDMSDKLGVQYVMPNG